MLEEPVGHLLERQPHVLEADLLADDVERHRGKAVVHRAHHARRARCRRRRRRRRCEPPAGAAVCSPSSIATRCATTAFSEQVLTNSRYFWRLSKKRKLRCSGTWMPAPVPALHGRSALGGATDEQRPPARIGGDVRAHALECRRRDASAFAQAVDEFAVVDGQPPEGRFGDAVLSAVVGDFAQQCFRLHGLPSSRAVDPGAISGQIGSRVNEFLSHSNCGICSGICSLPTD